MIPVPYTYNATTSIVTFPANVTQELSAQTIYAEVYLRGNGEGNLGYIFGHCDSAAANGIRLFFDSANTRFALGADSTGVALAPGGSHTTSSSTTGNFYAMGFTWDGGVLSAGFQCYLGTNGSVLVSNRNGAIGDGSGSVKGPASQTINIGNRTGSARTFDGDIFVVARWNRILSLEELRLVQFFGPRAVPLGLVFNFINGRDWGPYRLAPSVLTDLAFGSPRSVSIAQFPALRRRRRNRMALHYAYPIADIDMGSWTPSVGSTNYETMDEVVKDSADYARSPDNPTTQKMKVKFGPSNDPASSNSHAIDYELQAVNADTTFDLEYTIGSTVIDSWSDIVTVAEGPVVKRRVFSGAVADATTDYADRQIWVVARAPT